MNAKYRCLRSWALKRHCRRSFVSLLGLLLIVLIFIGKIQNDDQKGMIDPRKLSSFAALSQCHRLSESMKHELEEESASYIEQAKYQNKIAEARGERDIGSRGRACLRFLEERVLANGQSVLDLGCAAGAALNGIREILSGLGGHGAMVGVDLVPGWIQEAKRIFNGTLRFYNSDITEFFLTGEVFDVITLHDVIEHIQPERYGCLFGTLQRHSRPGTAVYFHVPAPEAQLVDDGQYFENVVPFHLLVNGMAMARFQIEFLSYDLYTDCGHEGTLEGFNTRNVGAKCITNGAPRYAHLLFRHSDDDKVFGLKRKVKQVG